MCWCALWLCFVCEHLNEAGVMCARCECLVLGVTVCVLVCCDVRKHSHLQTTPTVRLRSRLTFGSDRHFTQVTKGGVNTPPLQYCNSL